MGEFSVGKHSGVTAGDLTSAPDIGKVAPGRTNAVQSTQVGAQWIDHDAFCAGRVPTEPCSRFSIAGESTVSVRVTLVNLSIVVACGCSKARDASSLSERVQFACSILADDLRLAAPQYREFAGWMGEHKLSAEQQTRAELMLAYGAADGERGIAARGFGNQFAFCARTRRIEESAAEQLALRAHSLTSTFVMNPDPASMAQTIEGLAALAAEISHLPVRD
jgi:hypothetical protein